MQEIKRFVKIFKKLPQGDSAWFLTLRQLENQSELLPESIEERWVFICLDQKTQAIISLEVFHHQPNCHELLEFLTQAIENPIAEAKSNLYSPIQLQTDHPFLSNCLSSIHEERQIPVFIQEAVSNIEDFIKHLLATLSLSPPELPGLFSISGITSQSLIELCETTSKFYQKKPWDILAVEQIAHIKIDPPGTTYYVQVMGEANLEYGLLIFQDKNDLSLFYQFSHDPLAHLPKYGWYSLTYTPKDMIPEQDMRDFEDHKCEIASPNAYPFPMVYSTESMRRPDKNECRIMGLIIQVLNDLLEDQNTIQNLAQFSSKKSQINIEQDGQHFQIEIFFDSIPPLTKNVP